MSFPVEAGQRSRPPKLKKFIYLRNIIDTRTITVNSRVLQQFKGLSGKHRREGDTQTLAEINT